MPHQHKRIGSTTHQYVSRLQRKALGISSTAATWGALGIDNTPLMVYKAGRMSNTLAAAHVKCKHCDKTFPTQQALQEHMKKVEAGKRGGYRKHRPTARFVVGDPQPKRNGTMTALDRLSEIKARKAQLLVAIEQTLAEERAIMDEVQREYVETAERLAALSTEITVKRRVDVAVREEMEAHKPTPVEGT